MAKNSFQNTKPNSPIVLIVALVVCAIVCYYGILAAIDYYSRNKMTLASKPAKLPAQINTVYFKDLADATAFRLKLFTKLDNAWTTDYNSMQDLISSSLTVISVIHNTVLKKTGPTATFISKCYYWALSGESECIGNYPHAQCYADLVVHPTATALDTKLTKQIVDAFNDLDQKMKNTKPLLPLSTTEVEIADTSSPPPTL